MRLRGTPVGGGTLSDAGTDITALVRDVLANGQTLAEHTRSLSPDARWVSGGDAYMRWSAICEGLNRRLEELGDRVILDDDAHDAVDEVLTYLELDPYYYWSGFARTRMARRLAHARLDAIQKERGRRYVLACITGAKHCGQGLRPLAGAVADNATRRAVRAQLHSPDERVARRALLALSGIRHPGIDDGRHRHCPTDRARRSRSNRVVATERRATRALALDARVGSGAPRVTQHHDPERAAAEEAARVGGPPKGEAVGPLTPQDQRQLERSPGPLHPG